MRHRDGKLKIMHTIIGDFAKTLRKIAQLDEIESILTGTIAPSKSYRESLNFQYFTDNGIKLLAKTTTAVQEIFIVTSESELVLEELLKSGFVEQERPDVHHNHPRKKQQRGRVDVVREDERDKSFKRASSAGGQKRNNFTVDPLTLSQSLDPATMSALMKLKLDIKPQVLVDKPNELKKSPIKKLVQKQVQDDPDEDFAALFTPQDDEESFEELLKKSKLDPKFFK